MIILPFIVSLTLRATAAKLYMSRDQALSKEWLAEHLPSSFVQLYPWGVGGFRPPNWVRDFGTEYGDVITPRQERLPLGLSFRNHLRLLLARGARSIDHELFIHRGAGFADHTLFLPLVSSMLIRSEIRLKTFLHCKSQYGAAQAVKVANLTVEKIRQVVDQQNAQGSGYFPNPDVSELQALVDQVHAVTGDIVGTEQPKRDLRHEHHVRFALSLISSLKRTLLTV